MADCLERDTVWHAPQGAVVVMVAGALLAGATDLTFSLLGYLWITICIVSTAVYLLLIRLLKDRTGAHRQMPIHSFVPAPTK
jgi:hypothetical protein